MENAVWFYRCSGGKISFDGLVNYEGRRFGVPYSYPGAIARVAYCASILLIWKRCWQPMLLPGAARTVSATESTNPCYSLKSFPQHLCKHGFCSVQSPRRISPFPNSILTGRNRYEGNNLWAGGSRCLCFKARFFRRGIRSVRRRLGILRN